MNYPQLNGNFIRVSCILTAEHLPNQNRAVFISLFNNKYFNVYEVPKKRIEYKAKEIMLKIVLFGVSVHLIFLASIFQIYFQSPIIANLPPQQQLDESPAKR